MYDKLVNKCIQQIHVITYLMGNTKYYCPNNMVYDFITVHYDNPWIYF